MAGGVRCKLFRPGGTAEVLQRDLIEKFHRPFRTKIIFRRYQTLRVWLISARRSATWECAALGEPALRLMAPAAIWFDEEADFHAGKLKSRFADYSFPSVLTK